MPLFSLLPSTKIRLGFRGNPDCLVVKIQRYTAPPETLSSFHQAFN
uniref:Uncharacterized protein n=1 Tax=Aegilops tauschii subsp. strangulata TaxID=200361 RepID=A0A453S2F0_AEGTS